MLAPAALLLLLILPPTPAPHPTPLDGEGSLEGFLARARRERAALHVTLGAALDSIVMRLETPSAPSETELHDLRAELDRLGFEAAPLIVPRIDPGPPPGGAQEVSEAARRRAEEMTLALARLSAPGILEALQAAAETGTEAGRRNALRALASVPEREEAARFLIELHGRSAGSVRLACVETLARLGGPESAPILRGALTDPDPQVVRVVLTALGHARNLAAAPAVRNLMRLPKLATPVVASIVEYWRGVPEAVDEEVLGLLLGFTLRPEVSTLDRVSVLKAIPGFEAARERSFRDELDPVLASSDALVRQQAQVCAAILGDRSVRRELIRSFDETVEGNGNWWKAYQERGGILLEIGDHRDAARDLERALELLGNRAKETVHEPMWIDLARCHVKMGKLSRARDTLVELGLTPGVRERVEADPDFRPLVESSSYRKLFD